MMTWHSFSLIWLLSHDCGELEFIQLLSYSWNDARRKRLQWSFRVSGEHEYRRHVETTLSSFEAKLDVAKRQQLGYPIVDQGKRGWVDLISPRWLDSTHTR